jgi:uncharacterized protein with HEPN domain
MARKVGHALHDILEAIERIEEITNGKSLVDFEASWQLRWLVQRAIEIISEASRAIPDDLTNTQPDIPWRKIRGIGNVRGTTMKGSQTASSGTWFSTNCRA